MIAQPGHQPELDPSNDPHLIDNQWPSNEHKRKYTSQTYLHPFDFIWSELLQIEVPDQPIIGHKIALWIMYADGRSKVRPPSERSRKLDTGIIPVTYWHPRSKWAISKYNCLLQSRRWIKFFFPNRMPSSIRRKPKI